MNRLLLVVALLLLAIPAHAAERYVAATGNWNSTGTWSTSCTGATGSSVPVAGDNVHLCPGRWVTVPCGVDPVLGTMVDEPDGTLTWTANGGGLLADASECPAGDVPVWTFDNASTSTNAIVIDDMNANGSFIMKGRSIYDAEDATRLGVMDFSPGSCSASETTCFRTYPATAPYSAPTTLDTDLSPGTYTDFDSAPSAGFRLIRMTTGQHRGDVFMVQSTTNAPDTFRFSTGALGDMYATDGLKTPRDIGAGTITWTNTNPWRLSASLPTGTIWGTTTNYFGEGQCIVMDRGTTRPGTYYRVATSIDGGGSADTVIFDEFARLMPEDTTAPAAWWAPCLRPGDQFIAYEPMALLPAVPGSDSVNLLFQGVTVQPVLEYLHLPRATPAYLGGVGDSDSVIVFRNAGPQTINGPISVIGLNNRASGPQTAPYVFGIYGTSNSTFRGITGSGYYNPAPTATGNVWHGFTINDSANVTVDDWSMSWGNNECLWNSVADTPDDRAFEGFTGTISNGNCHDMWILASETGGGTCAGTTACDGGRGIAVSMTDGSHGTVVVRDNLVWAVAVVGLTVDSVESSDHFAYVYNNVIGPIHPDKQATSGSTLGLTLQRQSVGGTAQTSYSANNVLLANRPSNGTVTSIGLDQSAHAYYSYIGEHRSGLRVTNVANGALSPEQYGLLFDLGGPGTITTQGIEVQRSQHNGTGHTLRDIVVRRGCDFSGSGLLAGLQDDTSPGTTANWLDYQHITMGMWCSEAAGNDEGAPAGGTGGFRFTQASYLSTSIFKNILCITGDHNASDSDADNADFSGRCFDGSGSGTNNATLENVVCSSNRIGASVGTNCQNGMGPATNVNVLQTSTYPSSLGVLDQDLLTLRRESQNIALSDSELIGARYAGVLGYTQTMRDMGLDRRLLIYRATGDEEPDPTVLPTYLRTALRDFLIGVSGATGGGGRILPDHF